MSRQRPSALQPPRSVATLVHQLMTSTARACADRHPDAFRDGVHIRPSSDRPRIVLPAGDELELMTVSHVLVGDVITHWDITLLPGGRAARLAAVRAGGRGAQQHYTPTASVLLRCGHPGGWRPTAVVCPSPATSADAALHAIAEALAARLAVPLDVRITR